MAARRVGAKNGTANTTAAQSVAYDKTFPPAPVQMPYNLTSAHSRQQSQPHMGYSHFARRQPHTQTEHHHYQAAEGRAAQDHV
jgi:hypothetical protein